MPNIAVTINGNNFSDLESFYSEIDRVLTKNIDWQTGHNPDAFNDLLRGGFGVFEYEEPITIIWTNFSKSKLDLGTELINILIEIIREHGHIDLKVED